MKDVMLTDLPVNERKKVLSDSCDQIADKDYTRKFSSEELNQKRTELAQNAIRIANLENELKEVRADIKNRMKPFQDQFTMAREEIKAGGEFVTEECYKFVEGNKAAWYTPEGYKIDERDCTPDERQRTIFQISRENTGTNN